MHISNKLFLRFHSFIGDKVTSYGGFLRYTLRHIPTPGSQSSRNSAADVLLMSVSYNLISILLYFFLIFYQLLSEPFVPSSSTTDGTT